MVMLSTDTFHLLTHTCVQVLSMHWMLILWNEHDVLLIRTVTVILIPIFHFVKKTLQQCFRWGFMRHNLCSSSSCGEKPPGLTKWCMKSTVKAFCVLSGCFHLTSSIFGLEYAEGKIKECRKTVRKGSDGSNTGWTWVHDQCETKHWYGLLLIP